MGKASGWGGLYGKRASVAEEVYDAWVVAERERIRVVMRRRRAALRDAGMKLDGRPRDEPSYPENVLAHIDRWVEAHAAGKGSFAEIPLSEVTHYLRRSGRELGISGYDCIAERGVAKYLRKLGFILRRASDGMVVKGLR